MKVIKAFLKKHVPPNLKDEQCNLAFLQLKRDITKSPNLAGYVGTSLILSDWGLKLLEFYEKKKNAVLKIIKN
ncbi:MAG: hypothetical protein ACTSU2_14860 [Promethearchaeota archaeon]